MTPGLGSSDGFSSVPSQLQDRPPGVRVNVGRRGVGVSAGVRGARVSVNSRGTKTTSVGIPGTGLAYSDREQTGQAEAGEPVEANRKVTTWQIAPMRTLARLVGLVCLLMLVIGAFEHGHRLLNAGEPSRVLRRPS